MGGGFDKSSLVFRKVNYLAFKKGFHTGNYGECRIYPSPPLRRHNEPSVMLTRLGEICLPSLGVDQYYFWLVVTIWPAAAVTVHSPKPLKKYVCRSYVGHQKISVDVERLLAGLCGNDDSPPIARGAFSQQTKNLLIFQGTVLWSISAVVESWLQAEISEFVPVIQRFTYSRSDP
jgi:hypothetical protein